MQKKQVQIPEIMLSKINLMQAEKTCFFLYSTIPHQNL